MSNGIIGWFEDITLRERAEVGGKGGSLGELTRAGIAVPPGFVIRTAAFERFLQALESDAPLRARVEGLRAGDLDAIRAESQQLRARIRALPFPQDLADELRRAHADLRARCGGAPPQP